MCSARKPNFGIGLKICDRGDSADIRAEVIASPLMTVFVAPDTSNTNGQTSGTKENERERRRLKAILSGYDLSDYRSQSQPQLTRSTNLKLALLSAFDSPAFD
ncbi:hypothetical protein Bbelb_145530 [Branchiostoma belcheri]|nr:hypothetical protein Bbelb_145530 [Branchiostoma belcheri]